MSEAGELVEPALVFHFVVGGNFDLDARWNEGDELADGDANHAEAEAGSFGGAVLLRVGSRVSSRLAGGQSGGVGNHGRRGAGGGLLNNGFVVVVAGHLRVVDRAGDGVKDIERIVGGDVEELAPIAYAPVCQPVNHVVNEFFDRGIFLRLDRRVDVEGQGHGGVVQLLGADVHGAGAFADFNPVFAEAGIREDVDVAFFFVRHDEV